MASKLKVHMHTAAGGADFNLAGGEDAEIEASMARAFVAAGLADPIGWTPSSSSERKATKPAAGKRTATKRARKSS